MRSAPNSLLSLSSGADTPSEHPTEAPQPCVAGAASLWADGMAVALVDLWQNAAHETGRHRGAGGVVAVGEDWNRTPQPPHLAVERGREVQRQGRCVILCVCAVWR